MTFYKSEDNPKIKIFQDKDILQQARTQDKKETSYFIKG